MSRVQSFDAGVLKAAGRAHTVEDARAVGWCLLAFSGFENQDSRFRVQGSGLRVQGSGFRVRGSGFRVQGSGSRVHGSERRTQGPGLRA